MEDSEAYPPVGIVEIDDEHRVIAGSIGRLLEAVKDDDCPRCVALAGALIERAAAHFSHEEWLMVEIGFAFLPRHKRAHDRYLEESERRLEELRTHGLTANCLRWSAETREWFRAHVLTEDMQLGRALVAAGKGSR